MTPTHLQLLFLTSVCPFSGNICIHLNLWGKPVSQGGCRWQQGDVSVTALLSRDVPRCSLMFCSKERNTCEGAAAGLKIPQLAVSVSQFDERENQHEGFPRSPSNTSVASLRRILLQPWSRRWWITLRVSCDSQRDDPLGPPWYIPHPPKEPSTPCDMVHGRFRF